MHTADKEQGEIPFLSHRFNAEFTKIEGYCGLRAAI